VGTPRGARVDRVDPQRTGCAPSPLPASHLRVVWRVAVKTALEHAPVVDARGGVYVVGARGEVEAVGDDGGERWRVATGASGAGPAALLSDDTVVFVDGAGEAVAVRDGKVRWKVRIGSPDPSIASAPLPLDLGGVVVAAGPDLVALEAGGQEISRVRLPEAVDAPLLAAADRVVAVTSSGAVWSWAPGALDASRVGTFESPVEGAVAMSGPDTLIAVTHAGARLTEMHVRDGATWTRAFSAGAAWPGSPAIAGGVAYVVTRTASSDTVTAIDREGSAIGSAPLGSSPLAGAPDAGPQLLAPPPPTPILVDRASTVVFATHAGSVGAASRLGQADVSVELLAGVCPALTTAAWQPIAGIAPLSASTVVVACYHGEIAAVSASEGVTR
jgi:hypothetical protein